MLRRDGGWIREGFETMFVVVRVGLRRWRCHTKTGSWRESVNVLPRVLVSSEPTKRGSRAHLTNSYLTGVTRFASLSVSLLDTHHPSARPIASPRSRLTLKTTQIVAQAPSIGRRPSRIEGVDQNQESGGRRLPQNSWLPALLLSDPAATARDKEGSPPPLPAWLHAWRPSGRIPVPTHPPWSRSIS